jgi:hypothetical protein
MGSTNSKLKKSHEYALLYFVLISKFFKESESITY